MNPIIDVERTQSELDELFGEVSRWAGDPLADTLMVLLRAMDHTVAEARRMTLLLENSPISMPLSQRD